MVLIFYRRAGAPQKDPLDTEEVFCNDLGPDFFWFGKNCSCAWIAHGLRVDWPPDLDFFMIPFSQREVQRDVQNRPACLYNGGEPPAKEAPDRPVRRHPPRLSTVQSQASREAAPRNTAKPPDLGNLRLEGVKGGPTKRPLPKGGRSRILK